MTAYNEETLRRFTKDFESILPRRNELHQNFARTNFKTEEAQNFAVYGFRRRLGILARCIQLVFEKSSVDRLEILKDQNDVLDITIILHAFVLNCFGCVDNLAWILVKELEIKKSNGKKLLAKSVGLLPIDEEQYRVIRDHISKELRCDLKQSEEWFKKLKFFRHALVHKIPPYVPPYCVLPNDQEEYDRLEYQIQRLEFKLIAEKMKLSQEKKPLSAFHKMRKEIEKEREDMRTRQEEIRYFMPVLARSAEEGEPTDEETRFGLIYHQQMLDDFEKIEFLGKAVISELKKRSC